uniref:Tubulin-specific chaperone E n=1 Tax=Pygocentrus nattereri TaxID=42514 RepID=A0AAR2KNK8_PYGNA
MAQQLPEDAVGRRVSCDGERGTVRYVGTVPPTTGLWLGVEWDNPERGKHDGSHEGVCYFTCRHPTGGSFVRPKKANFGMDFLTAVKQRYELGLDQAIGEEVRISTKTVKMVDVGSLDLSGNLLSSWEVVAAITEQLEKLQVLYLRLAPIHSSINPFVRILLFSVCYLFSLLVLCCATMWPHIEELFLNDNDITELQRPVDVLQGLKVLDLSNNSLVQESVLQISNLSRLEILNLSSTGLTTIHLSDALPGTKTAMFPALKILLLDDNKISEWGVINELDKLSALVQLSCKRNPLMDLDKNHETTRQLLIARISQLEILNRSQVLQEERRGAELDYCKKFGRAWLQAGGHSDPEKNHPSAEFIAQHPRYLTLIQKYGAPEEDELKEQKPFALKDQLFILVVCIEIFNVFFPPGSMVVQKVRGLLYRLLKLPGTELRLSYTSSKMEGKEIEIDNDLKPLQFYSIEDGDRILVRWS